MRDVLHVIDCVISGKAKGLLWTSTVIYNRSAEEVDELSWAVLFVNGVKSPYSNVISFRISGLVL